MNDELSASADTLRDRDTLTQEVSTVAGGRDGSLGSADAGDERTKSRNRRLERLDDVLRNLDILIYAELAAVYYMEYVPIVSASNIFLSGKS